MHRSYISRFLVAAISATFGWQAHADIVTYSGSDYLGFPITNSNAAAQSLDAVALHNGKITFETSPVGFFSTLAIAPGVTLTLSGADSGFGSGINNDSSHPDGGYNLTSGGTKFLMFVPNTYTGLRARFDFATPVDSFGAYFTGFQPNYGGVLSFEFDDGTTRTVPITKSPSYGVAFAGFTDLGSFISSVTIAELPPFGSRDVGGIDDVQYRMVPEPCFAQQIAAVLGIASVLSRRIVGRTSSFKNPTAPPSSPRRWRD